MGLRLDLDKQTDLVERLREGERSAFDSLVRLCRQDGLNIVYNIIGNVEDAKDVLQEAFIKVYFNIKNFRGDCRLSTWFYRILVNCSFDFIRRRKAIYKVFSCSLTDEDTKEKEIPDERYTPAKIVLDKELEKKLDDSIASLAPKQRACFILRHRNGMSTSEIAKVLKCRVSTVKVHLFRAANNLQHKFMMHGEMKEYSLIGRRPRLICLSVFL